jgi:hypothetical protein
MTAPTAPRLLPERPTVRTADQALAAGSSAARRPAHHPASRSPKAGRGCLYDSMTYSSTNRSPAPPRTFPSPHSHRVTVGRAHRWWSSGTSWIRRAPTPRSMRPCRCGHVCTGIGKRNIGAAERLMAPSTGSSPKSRHTATTWANESAPPLSWTLYRMRGDSIEGRHHAARRRSGPRCTGDRKSPTTRRAPPRWVVSCRTGTGRRSDTHRCSCSCPQ